jgi:hypothetical protein
MYSALKVSALFFLIHSLHVVAQEISIRDDYSFHAFRNGPSYGVLEETDVEDQGGILYLFLDNQDVLSDSVVDVVLKDASGTISSPHGWYSWPGVMNASTNMFTGITIKGIEAPLSPHAYCKVIVTSLNGAVDSIEIGDIQTPDLRITNLIPTQDESAIYIYLRNDGATDMALDSIFFNTDEYSFSDDEVQLFGTGVVAPGEIEIIRLLGTDVYTETALAAVRVLYHDLATMTSNFTSSSTRCVRPSFDFGSWHSSGFNPENEYGRKRMRRLGIQMLHGPDNHSLMSDAFNRYHIKTILEASFGDPFDVENAIPEILELKDSSMMGAWSVDDEPDLSGKDVNQQIEKALAYMRLDTSTAVYVNLAIQSKYQRYGFYTDIVGMDHYAAPSAPNIIPLTWVPVVGRLGEVREAYEYMAYLKLNTEPRRNWSWVQFAAGIWDYQARPEAINYQFWAQLMAGAKGMEYFTATSETKDDFPEQWDEGIKSFKEFKQIRNVVLYGEPFGSALTSDTNVISGSLIGPSSMAVISVNNSITFEGNFLDGFSTTWSEIPYSVDVFVPNWISREDIYLVSEVGKSYDLNVTAIGPNTIRITPDSSLGNRSHTFYIGPNDTQVPNGLEGLLVAEYIDSANYTLSWKEAYDNIGVQGYNVYFNDSLVEKVSGLVYEVEDKSLTCSGFWKVEPFDNSGNIGIADSIYFVLSGPELAIMSHPTDKVVFPGGNTSFTVVPNSVVSYQWQYFNGSEWVDFSESLNSIGTQAATLNLNNINDEIKVRCKMKSPCSATAISDEAVVTINDEVGIEELFLRLSVYPNPSGGLYHVVSSNTAERAEVYDIHGKMILAIDAPTPIFDIDLSELSEGIYLLKVYAGNTAKTTRLIRY